MPHPSSLTAFIMEISSQVNSFCEKPDLDYFRAQAKKYGFDEDAYIKAVEKVPIWTRGTAE